MTADDTFQLTDALIAELQTMDTPTVCNALELLVPKRRGYGYTTKHLHCLLLVIRQPDPTPLPDLV